MTESESLYWQQQPATLRYTSIRTPSTCPRSGSADFQALPWSPSDVPDPGLPAYFPDANTPQPGRPQ